MPKIVDHDERRRHIAEAAARVVLRDGFEGMTMREVAAEAGYAHGAISRYFPNKQSLIISAFIQVFDDSENRVHENVNGIRGLAALEVMSRQILPYAKEGRRKSRVVLAFWDLAAQDAELQKLHQTKLKGRRALIRRFLTEAFEDGELGPHVDIETAVDEVSARNAGWQMLGVLFPDAVNDDRLDAGLDALISSLKKPLGRK